MKGNILGIRFFFNTQHIGLCNFFIFFLVMLWFNENVLFCVNMSHLTIIGKIYFIGNSIKFFHLAVKFSNRIIGYLMVTF